MPAPQEDRHHLRSAQRLLLRPSPPPLSSSSASAASSAAPHQPSSTRWQRLSRRVHAVLVGRPAAVAVCAVCATCAGLYAAFDLTQMALDRAVIAKLGAIPGFEQHYRSMRRQWSEGTEVASEEAAAAEDKEADTGVVGAAAVAAAPITTWGNNSSISSSGSSSDSRGPVGAIGGGGLLSPEDMRRRDPAVSEDLLALQMHLKNLEERVFVRREQAMRDRRI